MPETIAIPTRPEEITAIWLTKALRSTGVIHTTTVKGVQVAPMGNDVQLK